MLQKLHIVNYAIIDEIVIHFDKQLNVITGETGAGKSILMGALSLILGERAETTILQNRDKKCVIEGHFVVGEKPLVHEFLQLNEFDVDDTLVLRRELSAAGKSRGFINDTPATISQLKHIASLLVDLHQQFDTLELGDTDFQRQVLDALAGNTERLQLYRNDFGIFQKEKKALDELTEQKTGFYKELDYNQFLFDELNELKLTGNELEDMEEELKVLSNSENIKQVLTQAYTELKENEQPIVQQLKIMANQLSTSAHLVKQLPAIIDRLQTTQVELQDIAEEIDRLNDHVVFDQSRIEIINERLSAGYKLLKKHGVQTSGALLAIQQQLANQLTKVLQIDDLISEKKTYVAQLQQQVSQKAHEISRKRASQTAGLVQNVNQLLQRVGMPNSRIQVDITENNLSADGKDAIAFLFDANKSNRFEPIRKVASGGELSRLMLCIKSLVAETIDLPTLIFDEIDTGISGEAAKQVGLIMKALANQRQLICITHQPQIAGKANAHFFVYKENKGNAVNTNVRLLNRDERITSIAQMLSGESPTAAALENAREMVLDH